MISINLSNLAHDYEDREVFHSIALAFDGTCLAITGPNASGKSTLVKIITGLLTPSEGEVAVCIGGERVPRECLRDVVGLVAPDVRLYTELTSRENLEFICRVRGLSDSKDRVACVLEEVGLSQRADDLVSKLSTGLRQRACFAAALLHEPLLLLLDEPSSNLDSEGVRMVRSVIERQQSRGMVVVATNDPAEAELGSARLDLGIRR